MYVIPTKLANTMLGEGRRGSEYINLTDFLPKKVTALITVAIVVGSNDMVGVLSEITLLH